MGKEVGLSPSSCWVPGFAKTENLTVSKKFRKHSQDKETYVFVFSAVL